MGDEKVAWDKLLGELQKILLSPFLTIFFALFLGAVKFIPQDWANALSIVPTRAIYASWIGLGFLAFVIMNFLHLGAWLRKKGQGRATRVRRENRISNLTRAEKIILGQFLDSRNRTANLSPFDGVVLGLVEATILWGPLVSAAPGYVSPFNLQNWAWDYLNKHPEVLELNS